MRIIGANAGVYLGEKLNNGKKLNFGMERKLYLAYYQRW